jgi:hypothetical protein
MQLLRQRMGVAGVPETRSQVAESVGTKMSRTVHMTTVAKRLRPRMGVAVIQETKSKEARLVETRRSSQTTSLRSKRSVTTQHRASGTAESRPWRLPKPLKFWQWPGKKPWPGKDK